MFNFNVRESCKATWAPVDDAFCTIDKTSVIHLLKDRDNGVGHAFIHSETLTRPVNTRTHSLHLI